MFLSTSSPFVATIIFMLVFVAVAVGTWDQQSRDELKCVYMRMRMMNCRSLWDLKENDSAMIMIIMSAYEHPLQSASLAFHSNVICRLLHHHRLRQ